MLKSLQFVQSIYFKIFFTTLKNCFSQLKHIVISVRDKLNFYNSVDLFLSPDS
jgi:hypothetical protein